MEEFKLEANINTIQFKAITFLGLLLLGLIIWLTFSGLNSSEPSGINAVTGLLSGFALIFALSFGNLRRQSLVINDQGFHARNYRLNLGGKEKIKWEKISGITLIKNKIVVKYSIGTTERMSLPMLHTKQQILQLKEYLQEAAKFKNLEFTEA